MKYNRIVYFALLSISIILLFVGCIVTGERKSAIEYAESVSLEDIFYPEKLINKSEYQTFIVTKADADVTVFKFTDTSLDYAIFISVSNTDRRIYRIVRR